MRCRVCQRKLTPYSLRELNGAERQAVDEHLAQCARCREKFAELQRLEQVLTPAAAAAPRRDLWPDVAARIETPARRQGLVPRRVWQPLTAAAVLTAVALVVILMGRPQIPVIENGYEADTWMAETETSVVWDDPWAGDVAQALELALSEEV